MPEDYEELIARLIANSSESQTVEFKESNDDAFMIGKDISALANSAVIEGQDYAYMVWGVRDDTHEVVGTTFNPLTAKHSRQELELWLRLKLSKNAEIPVHPNHGPRQADGGVAHLAGRRISGVVRRYGIHPIRHVHTAGGQELPT